MKMLSEMPDWHPVVEEMENPPRPFAVERWSQAAQYPPIQKLADGRLVVDWWTSGWSDPRHVCPRRVWALVWKRADHPNLKLLPINAPRAVKTLYRADTQLSLLRGNYTVVETAIIAWDAYVKGSTERARPAE